MRYRANEVHVSNNWKGTWAWWKTSFASCFVEDGSEKDDGYQPDEENNDVVL